MPHRRLSRTRNFLTCAIFLVAIAGFCPSLATSAQYSVEAVKAAYLFRFAQYVEWPEATSDAPFIIAVSGADDVAAHLERLLPGMNVNGRRAEVRRVTRVQDLEGVHILFIGANTFGRTRALRTRAIEKPILIVTESEDGIDGGAVINFIEVDRKLRFEISLNAADRSGLRINSALLSVAARVERRPQGALNCPDGNGRRQRLHGCRIRLAGAGFRRGA